MDKPIQFFRAIVDSLTEEIAVIDETGVIQYVNDCWVKFAQNNECLIKTDWQGINYLEVCNRSAKSGEEFGKKAMDGIRRVINHETNSFYLEYDCHSREEKRWFIMRVTPLCMEDSCYYVISHLNITERVRAEEQVLALSRSDSLTGLSNRRYFDEFLSLEWRRCKRLNVPISLVLLDIDYFKLLNDHYGHQAGDDCLKKIGQVLRWHGKRPGDLAARYGGEEFALILGNTTNEESEQIAQRIQDKIANLAIPNVDSPTHSTVTASMGVATMYPKNNSKERILLESADRLLYSAKEEGRNRITTKRFDSDYLRLATIPSQSSGS